MSYYKYSLKRLPGNWHRYVTSKLFTRALKSHKIITIKNCTDAIEANQESGANATHNHSRLSAVTKSATSSSLYNPRTVSHSHGRFTATTHHHNHYHSTPPHRRRCHTKAQLLVVCVCAGYVFFLYADFGLGSCLADVPIYQRVRTMPPPYRYRARQCIAAKTACVTGLVRRADRRVAEVSVSVKKNLEHILPA